MRATPASCGQEAPLLLHALYHFQLQATGAVVRVATAAPDGLHTHEDAEVLIDFGDAGVLSGRRDSPQSRPPSAAAPSRSQCGPTLGTFRKVPPLPNLHSTLGTASKKQAQRPGTPALGRSAAPAWGPRWLPQHCGSHARTVVQCAHSGGVGLGTRPLVRSQRTVRRYPYPPGPLLSPTLGSTIFTII